jgi:uncharacterized repeat protein (TIGR02543 family)
MKFNQPSPFATRSIKTGSIPDKASSESCGSDKQATLTSRLTLLLTTFFLTMFGQVVNLHAANSLGECYVSVNVSPGTTLPTGWSYQLQYFDTDSQWYNGASGTETRAYYKQQGDWGNKSIQWRCQLKYNFSNYGTVQTNTCYAGSDSVSFSVAAPAGPSISGQPASQTVQTGASVTFTVTATGAATLTYQWRKNDVSISGAVGTSYTISPVATGDAGSYTCLVSNPGGSSTSQAAVLTVGSSPPPTAPDSDSDGLPDSVETNTDIYVSPTNTGTNPNMADTDGDGVPDGLEVKERTNPNNSSNYNNFSKGLSAYYPFSGNPNDESGHGFHGISLGSVLTANRSGTVSRAYAFDGIDDVIATSGAASIVEHSFSLSLWFKAEELDTLQAETTSGTRGYAQHYIINPIQGGTKSGIGISGGTNGISVFEHGNAFLPAVLVYSQPLGNNWVQAVLTCYQDGPPQLFINGVHVRAGLQTGRSKMFSAFVDLGAGIGGGGYGHFKGAIDDVRVYNRALSNDEVSALYVSEIPVLQKTLTLSQLTHGSVTGGGLYDINTTATLAATADSGYVFAGWTGDVSGTTNPLDVVMDTNKTIGATFAPDLTDTDTDGLTAYDEVVIYGTDPTKSDTDGDGLMDGYEVGIGRYSVVWGSKTWAQARADAVSKGGLLATFATEGERNRAMLEIGSGALLDIGGLWIGATDQTVEGTWTWITSEPFTFSNWATGQPDNLNDSDFAAVAGDLGGESGKWYDYRAVTTRDGYILETGYSTNPTDADSDHDGLSDGMEQSLGTNPFLTDTDSDGLTEAQEVNLTHTNPAVADTDGDGINDGADDQDGDGVSNRAEITQYGTDPLRADSDNDGINDGVEINYAGSFYKLVQGSFTYAQAVADATAKRGRVASFPNAADYSRMATKARQTTQAYLWIGLSDAATEGTWKWTDGSTTTYNSWLTGQPSGGVAENHVAIMENSTQWADADENYVAAGYIFERVGLDPLDPDTDADGLTDGQEISTTHSNPVLDDTDGDGLLDGTEVNTHGSSPLLTDTDADGINDRVEVEVYHTNPALKDSDGDGFDDLFEINTGFNPNLASSTPDALSSIRTAVEFRFNAATGVSYRIEASTDLNQWDIIEPAITGQSGVVTRFYSTENQPNRFFRVRRN